MRIITTNSLWAQIILAIILTGLGLGLLTLFQNPATMMLGGTLLIIGLIALPWAAYICTNTKNNVIGYFSACPICESPNILIKLAWAWG